MMKEEEEEKKRERRRGREKKWDAEVVTGTYLEAFVS